MRLEGKSILLTGATGGLGRALAKRLAAAGASLVLSATDRDSLAALSHDLSARREPRVIAADLGEAGAAGKLFEDALAACSRIDVIVNAAGLGYFALGDESSPEATRRLFEINTFAPWELAHAALPSMREQGGGYIVNVLSVQGRVPMPTTGVYGGSKTALSAMMNTMRFELAQGPVRMLNIFPGTMDTRFDKHALREAERPGVCLSGGCGRPPDEVAEEIVRAIERGRRGELWLDLRSRLLAAAAIVWPSLTERFFGEIRDWAVERPTEHLPHSERRWRLWQLESSLACNLRCVMCPWTAERCRAGDRALMSEEVWASVRPHLGQIASLDFTGGGEPLLNPRLLDWMAEAKAEGCTVGFLTNGVMLDERTCERLIELEADWIATSIDGASRDVYQSHRPGSDFDLVCGNLRRLAAARTRGLPRMMINFVMMPGNAHEVTDIVRLAGDLGVDVVNLKQADVVRGEDGAGFALFAGKSEREVERLEHKVRKAKRIGSRIGVDVRSARFKPEEEPVCEQDPRDALFVRYDGSMAPCINLAIGGPTTFLGSSVTMPVVHYGRLPDDDPLAVWERPPCTTYRDAFTEREHLYWKQLSGLGIAPTMNALREAKAEAEAAMPDPPDGCRHCHYLYGL